MYLQLLGKSSGNLTSYIHIPGSKRPLNRPSSSSTNVAFLCYFCMPETSSYIATTSGPVSVPIKIKLTNPMLPTSFCLVLFCWCCLKINKLIGRMIPLFKINKTTPFKPNPMVKWHGPRSSWNVGVGTALHESKPDAFPSSNFWWNSRRMVPHWVASGKVYPKWWLTTFWSLMIHLMKSFLHITYQKRDHGWHFIQHK